MQKDTWTLKNSNERQLVAMDTYIRQPIRQESREQLSKSQPSHTTSKAIHSVTRFITEKECYWLLTFTENITACRDGSELWVNSCSHELLIFLKMLWRRGYGYSHFTEDKIEVWGGCIIWLGEGNGNPLQYSCLENSVDGGAWWSAVYGVTQNPTGLKWLSSSSCSIICLNSPHYWAENMGGHPGNLISIYLFIYLFISVFLWLVYFTCNNV